MSFWVLGEGRGAWAQWGGRGRSPSVDENHFSTFPTRPLAHFGHSADTSCMTIRTKKADGKGRITLGERFANQTLIFEERGDEIVIRLARVVPLRETWLYENPEALRAVRAGLNQARAGELTAGPDLKRSSKLADKISDD